jgi:hypothetical protein
MSKLLEAVREASMSVADLLRYVAVDEDNILNNKYEPDFNILQKQVEHLQGQILIIENHLLGRKND